MRRSSGCVWGAIVLGAYIVFAVVAAFLLASSCVTTSGTPGSRFDAMRYYSQVCLVTLALFVGFAALGLVLVIAGGTFVAWVAEEVGAWKRARRKER
jgi:hypothetical protein